MTFGRSIFVVLFTAVSMTAMTWAEDNPFDDPLPDVKGYINEQTISIMSGATRVESFRIKNPPRQRKGQPPATAPAEKIGFYWVVGHGKEMDRDFAVRFTKVAFDGKSYIQATAGCFDPGVAFRFWKGRESADVLICFHCGNIEMRNTGGKEGQEITFHHERGRPAFVKLAKEAFPDDPEIQKLIDVPEKPVPVKQRLGERTVAIVTGATRAEVFRLSSRRGEKGKEPTTFPSDGGLVYDIRGHAKTLEKEFVGRFSAVLLNDTMYKNAVSVCPDADVAFRLWKENEYVDVVITFSCHNLVFYNGGSADPGERFYIDPKHGGPIFVKFGKEAFPDDPEIQKLKE